MPFPLGGCQSGIQAKALEGGYHNLLLVRELPWGRLFPNMFFDESSVLAVLQRADLAYNMFEQIFGIRMGTSFPQKPMMKCSKSVINRQMKCPKQFPDPRTNQSSTSLAQSPLPSQTSPFLLP